MSYLCAYKTVDMVRDRSGQNMPKMLDCGVMSAFLNAMSLHLDWHGYTFHAEVDGLTLRYHRLRHSILTIGQGSTHS